MLTREAALERAQTEGLTEKLESLRSSTNKSGFKNVTHHCDTEKHKTSKKSRPYQLTRHIEKRRRAASLGYFASAEAAALVQAHILRLEENAHANSSVQQYNQLQQAIAPQPQHSRCSRRCRVAAATDHSCGHLKRERERVRAARARADRVSKSYAHGGGRARTGGRVETAVGGVLLRKPQ